MSPNSQTLILRYSQTKPIVYFVSYCFVQSFNCLYLWNQLPNLCGVFTKLKRKQYPNRKCQKIKNNFFDFRLILLDRITYLIFLKISNVQLEEAAKIMVLIIFREMRSFADVLNHESELRICCLMLGLQILLTRPCLKISAVLQKALLKILRCAVHVHFASRFRFAENHTAQEDFRCVMVSYCTRTPQKTRPVLTMYCGSLKK